MRNLLERLPSLDRIQKEQADRHLGAYINQAWPVLEPATQFMHNWHIDAIAEHLEAAYRGQIKRLIINMPPRYMKSIAVSVVFPTWVWTKKPESRWIFASYSSSLSTKHSLDRRAIIQSPWYQGRWGNKFKLSDDQNIKTEYTNNKRGHMIATSVGGTATGKGGDFIIVDDPVNPKEAQSEALRTEANSFFDQTLTTRLDNKKKGVIIIVMQRLHENDLTGHVLKKQAEERDELGYEYVQLELPATAPTRMVVDFPISGDKLIREEGDILWPEREGEAELAAVKRNLGSYGYAGQYQQNPSPAEGGILKRQWFNRYKVLPPMSSFDMVLISLDCAFKDKVDNDWVVFQVWGQTGSKKYLIDQVRRKLDFPGTQRVFKEIVRKYPMARTKIIEDKANGSAIIQSLKDEIDGLIAVDPQGGKVARAHAAAPYLEAGDVYIPDESIADWSGDLVEECAKFPNAQHDDQVDTMTQALIHLSDKVFIPWATSVDWL